MRFGLAPDRSALTRMVLHQAQLYFNRTCDVKWLSEHNQDNFGTVIESRKHNDSLKSMKPFS